MQKVPYLIFLGVFFFSLLILFIGVSLNSSDLKYKRYSSFNCSNGLLILQLPSSDYCCSSYYHSSDWSCIAAYDYINHIFSSIFAWSIPVIPLVFNIIIDIFKGYFQRNQRTYARRLLFYVFIFFYRTIILYYVGGLIENYSQTETPKDCWYSSMIKSGRCSNTFDYSDHTVLYFTHYIIPVGFELTYIFYYSEHVKSPHLGSLSTYTLSILSSIIILLLTCRCILFTAMYFHTGSESLAAAEIVFIGLIVPLYLLRSNPYFQLIFL